jgi:transcriptional regulator with XRE-family HTH domain
MNQKQMSHALLNKNPKCGLSPKRVSDIEINRSAIRLHELAAYTEVFDCTMESLLEQPVERETDAWTMDERVDSVENRCYELEQAHIKLKARVDFIVEILNTLQDIHNAPKELFQ